MDSRIDTVTWSNVSRRVIFFMAAALCLLSGCQVFEDQSVPPDLTGYWYTEAPGYEKCHTEITDKTISFLTVEGTLRKYTIARVARTVKIKDEVKYNVLDIHYKDKDGDAYLLSVLLNREEGNSRLQFFHQPHLTWTRGN